MVPVFILIVLGAFGSFASAYGRPHLTISAAISLKPLLDDVLPTYQQKSDITVAVDYGASGLLARRILEGAPSDIFLAAAPEYLDRVNASRRAIQESRVTVAKGALALVVPQDKSQVQSFRDLKDSQVSRIALGDESFVPLGQYSLEILKHLGLYDPLHRKIVKAPNARQVLSYVESGATDAGIVYQSDALSSPKVKIVQVADKTWHAPVLYEGILLKRTSQAGAAKALLNHLSSRDLDGIRQRHGFQTLGP